ncbi:23S rRNA (pseudouridine1915-N3)-methyltransferase [Anaerobranca californiensis DSM 14826]|jgi:23S rRNA (pseudouridine1915-N3)-methyltransferase|uniref:Ribosomal RNA large subunit methyltransferase H n=1 Tax=Anaerobranca californiensis DSM 14826 TaxID=1120989 RepID=A0A1M6M4X8_9FIRM|nr:23S rRNA (pseudouridine(1915)-N(3))-methyltransferase RlmH [Anaerobranca californiensis]SHJ78509.1 23S rRNA (pseudouridine1915-N3)-methyltransferase [Anaerobranca californiensis DSM 14826]
MQIDIIAVGKIKEKYLNLGIEEFRKRLSSYCKLNIIEIPDERTPDNASPSEEEYIKEREGEKIIAKIRDGSYVIPLALTGKMLSSEELAEKMNKLAISGNSHVTFVIGGSLGLSNSVLQRGNFQLSFSRMTFPHQLMRLILLEQIYRGFRINRGEPYHK